MTKGIRGMFGYDSAPSNYLGICKKCLRFSSIGAVSDLCAECSNKKRK